MSQIAATKKKGKATWASGKIDQKSKAVTYPQSTGGKKYGRNPYLPVKLKQVPPPPNLASDALHDGAEKGYYGGVSILEAKTARQPDEADLANELVAEVADSGTDVNALCETYKLKREELGRLTGFSLRALAEWSAGKLPSQPAKRRLQEVRRLLDALAQIVKRESIPQWLHHRNPAFAPLTPLQVIELGEMDRLWAMVHDMGSGQPD